MTGETAVAIVGRPNVGKSSLVNRLLREERMIVSEMPGTTRDAVDATCCAGTGASSGSSTPRASGGPGRVARSGLVEAVSVRLARRAVERADVAVVVIDAEEGATDQDGAIAGEADRAGCGIVLAVNKWDLIKGKGPGLREDVRREAALPAEVPGVRADRAPVGADRRAHRPAARGDRPRGRGAAEAGADRRAEPVRRVGHRRAPAGQPGSIGHQGALRGAGGVAPPTFVFFTNVATTFHFSYERFLQNQLREAFGFEGTPIRIQVRARGRRGDARLTAPTARAILAACRGGL